MTVLFICVPLVPSSFDYRCWSNIQTGVIELCDRMTIISGLKRWQLMYFFKVSYLLAFHVIIGVGRLTPGP